MTWRRWPGEEPGMTVPNGAFGPCSDEVLTGEPGSYVVARLNKPGCYEPWWMSDEGNEIRVKRWMEIPR